jgi:hypothetical protein
VAEVCIMMITVAYLRAYYSTWRLEVGGWMLGERYCTSWALVASQPTMTRTNFVPYA